MSQVSVAMVVRNGAAHLAEALGSLRSQHLHDIEILVVDDGSTDATPDILRGCAAADPRVRLVERSAIGPVAGLNEACRLARGPYVARLDADDTCHPSRLVDQHRFMEERPDVLLVGGAIELIDPEGRVLGRFGYPTRAAEIRNALATRNCFAHSAVFFRREAFLRAGGYRESYSPAEDYDLWLRMRELGPLANLSSVTTQYRLHDAQQSLNQLEAQALKSLAARISAGRRASGEAELAPEEMESAARLRSAGVADEDLRASLLEQYLTWAETLSLAGVAGAEAAESLLARARDVAGAPREQRMTTARTHWLHAKQALAAGRVQGLQDLLLSLAADPTLAGQRIWQRLTAALVR